MVIAVRRSLRIDREAAPTVGTLRSASRTPLNARTFYHSGSSANCRIVATRLADGLAALASL